VRLWVHRLTAFGLLTVFATSDAFAGAPSTPNLVALQGRVTLTGGGTVPDGSHTFFFRLFGFSSGGAAVFSEPAILNTLDGVFSHNLGTGVSLPNTIFQDNDSLWLEIEVNGEIMTPRSRFTSVPYSHLADGLECDNGGGGGFTQLELNKPLGRLSLFFNNEVARLSPGSLLLDATSVTSSPDISLQSSGSGAGLTLRKQGDLNGINMSGGSTANGASLALSDGAGNFTIVLNPAFPDPAQLPDESIESVEIADESGIAGASNGLTTTLTQGVGTMEDVLTVTITIPAPGYVWVTARGTIRRSGTVGQNSLSVQIDKTAGGSASSSHRLLAGASSHSAAGYQEDMPFYIDRKYFEVAPGAFTYRVEASAHSTNSAGALTQIITPSITATYFPTSYGTVTTTVSGEESEQFVDKQAVISNAHPEPTVSSSADSEYEVDLRELESQAKQDALEARAFALRLFEARLATERDAATAEDVENK
jgi:hypothetical protein